MKKFWRLLATSAIIAFALLPIVVGSTAHPAGAANGSGTGLVNLATCFQQNHRMAVELLVDQTGSLGAPSGQGTDPLGHRVDFGQAVVGTLSGLQSTFGGTIDVSAAGFGVGVNTYLPFTSLTTDSAPTFAQQLEVFRRKFQDQSTDYVTALLTAKDLLVNQAQQLSPTGNGQTDVCKVVVWLTDGMFDVAEPGFAAWWDNATVTASNAQSVQQDGLNRLCAPNGVADRLRAVPDLFLIAVGLSPPGRSQPPDFSTMSAVALGLPASGSGQWSGNCGSLPAINGTFFANDLSGLAFDVGGGLLSTPPPTPTQGCASNGCSLSFTTYPHTVGARFLMEPQQVGQLVLAVPGGTTVPLTPGTSNKTPWGSVTVGSGAFPAVTIALTPSGAAPAGQWTVSGQPNGPSPSLVYTDPVVLSSGVGLIASADSPAWHRGELSTSNFVLQWAGQALPKALTPTASSLQANVTLGSTTVQATTSALGPRGVLEVSFTPPKGDPNVAAQVVVTGTVTLPASEGGLVVPVSASTTAAIRLSGVPSPRSGANFGIIRAVSAHRIDPVRGVIGQPTTVTAELNVYGAPGDDGKFCILPGQIRPSGGGPTGNVVATPCTPVPAGEVVQVPVTITLPDPWDGSLHGAVIHAQGRSFGKSEPIDVEVLGTVQLPNPYVRIDQGTFWLLIALSILGAAVAWAAAAYFTSSLHEANGLRGYSTRAVIGEGTAEIESFADSPDNWKFLSARGTWHDHSASFTAKDLQTKLDLRAPVRILSVQDVVVTREGHVVEGSMGHRRGRSRSGRIDHRIQGEWVFTVPTDSVVTADTTELSGDLTVFVRLGAIGSEAEPSMVSARAQAELAGVFRSVADRLLALSGRDNQDGDDEETPSPVAEPNYRF